MPVVDRCTIGRHPGNTIAIGHMKVSRWHATIISLSDREFRLMDFDTKNGTWLNNQRIKDPIVLADGDTIRIGPVELRFTKDDSVLHHTPGMETTIMESARDSDRQDADYEPTGYGMISLSKTGKIRAITEAARQWLTSFYGMRPAVRPCPRKCMNGSKRA